MKWIFETEIANPGKKTRIWMIRARESGVDLGRVLWETGWRRYVFAPAYKTVFEQDCLRDIARFIEEKTRERKAERAKEKAQS